jgi:hypothetical protein
MMYGNEEGETAPGKKGETRTGSIGPRYSVLKEEKG